MYNYHRFIQNDRQVEQLKKIEQSEQHYQETKAKKEKEMINNHQKRVQYSILRLIDQPTKVNIYHNSAYRPREEDKQKRAVPNQMHFSYEQESSRIKRSLHRNSSLDLVPFKNAQSYCFRNQSQMRSCHKRSQNQGKTIYEAINSLNVKSKKQEDQIVIQSGKEVDVYPKFVKHPKAYFHTFQTIVNQADSLKIFIRQSQKRKRSQQRDKLTEDSDPFQYLKQMPLFQNKNVCKQNIKKVPLKVIKCKQALQKCGLMSFFNTAQRKQHSRHTQR